MFSKIDVNGDERHPLYAWMAGEEVGPDAAGDVAWNFAKFLIGKDGNLIARFAPPMEPCAADVKTAIDEALG
jgi:glutathione peroxidase